MFLRKCVVSVSLRFVFDFLIPFDFGGGLSFGGVVVTVSKRPFPYLSISFSTFFQRSKKGCVFFIYIFNVGVPLSSSNYLVGSFLHFAALLRTRCLHPWAWALFHLFKSHRYVYIIIPITLTKDGSSNMHYYTV